MSDGPPPQQPDPAAPVVSRETASPRREAEAKGAVPTPPPPETRQPQPTPTARASPPIQQPPQQRPQQQQQEEQMDTSHPLAATQVSQEMETTFTDDPKTVEPVQNGLQLKTQKKQLKAFTYALAPGTDAINPVKKKVLVVDDDGVQADHVAVHRLEPSQKLVEVVAGYRQRQLTKAVVVVNTSDSLILEPVYLEGYEGSNYPVLIVSKSDGREILHLVEHEEEDVLCDIEAESAVDAVPHPRPPGHPSAVTEQPRPGGPKGTSHESKTTGGGFRNPFKSSGGMKNELKKLLFSGDIPIPMSEDSGKFCLCMSVFQNYEILGKLDQSQVKDALQKLHKHMDSVFNEDFPFYIVLAYRLHKKMTAMYGYEDCQHFVMTCINKMEATNSYPPIATTLKKFLGAGDFTIMFGDIKANSSVFRLLEEACIHLCKLSFQSRVQHAHKKSSSSMLHDRFIFNTMLWVSLSLKVRSHRGTVTRGNLKIWKDQLTSRSHLISMNDFQIECLKNGLLFGKAIDLPRELRLNAELMQDMLVPPDPSSVNVRYFTHLSHFFIELHGSLNKQDFLIILTYLRSAYDHCLKSGHTPNYSLFSKSGTLAGTLSEGLDFLNTIVDVCTQRKIVDLEPKSQTNIAKRKVVDPEIESEIKAELWKWLKLLLQLIDVTKDQADLHLKQFVVKGKGKGVVKHFQKEIRKIVIVTTQDNFPQLPIQRFFPLYSAFKIWPSTILEDYLTQYKVPRNVRISDATWAEFFQGVSERFSGAHAHYFINDFLQSVAGMYQESGRARDFVLDLLWLNASGLLAIDPGTGERETSKEEGEKVQKDFKQFLHNFIRRNALKHSLLGEMSVIMTSIAAERDEFQGLVLDVLKKEVIPEFKVLQGEESLPDATVMNIVTRSVTELCKNLGWLTSVSPKQGFCWGIVATCCSKIPVRRDSLEWIQDYDYLINQLCHVYKAFCTGQGMRAEEDRRLKEELPKQVLHDEDVKTYFEWVQKVQSVVLAWQERVRERKLNYDEILLYANMQRGIQSIGDAISASSSILEPHILQQHKNAYLQQFEELNVMLLRYIPGKPEVKWCTLSSLLAENGVSFPPELAESITKYVEIPGETKEVEGGLLENEMRCDTSGQFKPGQAVSLKLSKKLGLRDLVKLVSDLQVFLEPILDQMEMLVFFKLHKSDMFNKYQKLYLDKEMKKLERKLHPPMPSVMSTFGNFPSVSLQPTEPQEVKMSLPILVRSLDQTKELLIKLIEGNATYNEIIAEGQLDLENLDIDREFDILSGFILHLKHTLKSEVGLEGVRCMLELFQYQRHILKIRDVCDQYKLKGCLEDDDLKELVEIAEELGPEKSRRELTLIEATNKMKQVRKLLFGTESERVRSQCLKLFDAVADSAAFYQFMKDKRFSGAQGQAVFTQQYQLITAQLQHEEYDEQVLNHLFAAYKFMLPFMNVKQDFSSLMDQVVQLDTSNGLKQLETVNRNITLIQLWFSRAEGDTLQNVANELEQIIDTGVYIFTLSSGASGGEASMTLQYTPAARLTLPPTSTGDDIGASRMLHSSESFQETGVVNGTQLVSRDERWTREQINDFVRKLGFLDTQKEGGDKIKHFLHINEVANKLLELHVHLKDLGHPQYLKSTETRNFPCSTHSDNADGEVADTESKLTSWVQRVTQLRSQNQLLLFFSVPKQLLLYQLINGYSDEREEEVADELVREVMFLVTNNPTSREELKHNIMRCLPRWHSIIPEYTAMEIVGGFLGDLLQHHTLPRRSTKVIRRVSSATQFPGISDGNQFLHHAPKYQQSQLVRLIVGIYGGVPESFEVFHCRASTTQEELSLFLERMERRPLRYLILEVNKLPFRLQEYLMQCYLKIQQMARKYQAEREHLQSGEYEASPAHNAAVTATSTKYSLPTIHFVETAASVLRELPWILLKEHKEGGPNMTFSEAQKKCQEAVKNFAEIQLVYGRPGDGKTHYIKQQLEQSSHSLTIAVNEAFTPLSAIKKLRSLPPSQRKCAVFLNFTMLPPGESVDESEDRNYKELMKVIGWFFFDLILLGYVEDPVTGLSVSIPGGMDWRIYVEVPSRISSESPKASLDQFIGEIPALGMLGVSHPIDPSTPYTVDEDVQLVCKYLKAYWVLREQNRSKGINKLFREVYGKKVKFSMDPDILDAECHQLLNKSWPVFASQPKVTQKLFIKYMKRRCAFLDQLPAFNYNTGYGEYFEDPATGKKMASDTRELGSTLMSTMLQEVIDFCNPEIKENWSLKAHQQLIYDFKDGGGSFGLLSLRPDQLPKQDKTKFEKIRVKMPSMMELYSREVLDDYLSRALNIELDESKRLALIDKSDYVLTLDYTIKMLNIHERYECGVPVIIEGETGVGKTALVEMLSKLWNQSLLIQWKRKKDQILEFMRKKLGDLNGEDTMDEYMKSLRCVEDLSADKSVKEDDLITLCLLPDANSTTRRFYSTLRGQLLLMQNYPVISLLTIKGKTRDKRSLNELFAVCKDVNTAETTASLLQAVMVSEVKSTFYKINVHAALTPDQIWCHLQPAIEQANSLREAYKAEENEGVSLRLPFVTVFLDEVNTSSCLGLFKEIIVDRTFDGVSIPENVFIVAACNPHRGNSLAAHGQHSESSLGAISKESWTRSTYYVRQLHPTLDFLKWDYGALDEHQEREYINAKMKMLNKGMENVDVACLTDLIVESQKLMRKYACEQLKSTMRPDEAKISSRSCVSQRDIQRVFTFFQWFQTLYQTCKYPGENCDNSRRAILVSLGIVYYMRLNTKYREAFQKFIDRNQSGGDISFSRAFENELDWFIKEMELPTGIAQTQALKENLFATVVCTGTHTPLIIVGAPGSSKTLSFNLTIANLKGQESKKKVFRETAIFHSLDPHFYQCSRRTTSNEIDTVFSRAINRQRSHLRFSLPIYCVVFMDEAGLPEESHESLKVLHYHLDRQEVSFVAITNHMLDAAKSNRAVCLFRPEASEKDLETLARGCLSSKLDSPPPELQRDLNLVVKFCPAFSQLMKNRTFSHFFGLRDFIHFVNYLRRRRDRMLNQQLVMEALERNFNGYEQFDKVAESFMNAMGCQYASVQRRSILTVLKDSLNDRPSQDGRDMSENEVRYKLIIDPSEDDSLIRLLFSLGVLDRENTRMYVCSDFPGDSQIQKINTIAAIRHSAIEGHTVVMSQTDDIHESFYDLFNQRFRRIDDQQKGPRYYTNIAIGAHLRPCRVHPNFQCVVVVKKSEVVHTPAPFLNRFEKYCITHETLLKTALTRLPPCLKRVVLAAQERVEHFVEHVGLDGLYGFKLDTVNSLILSLLPPVDFEFHCEREQSLTDPTEDIRLYMLRLLVHYVRRCSGLHIPFVPPDELLSDAEEVFAIVMCDPEFEGVMKDIEHHQAKDAVHEAVNMLHAAPDPESEVERIEYLNPEGCLVVMLLQQWLVRHLTKRMMQLMTLEAFTEHRSKIPSSYLKNYLTHQAHFSLSDLIDRYLKGLASKWEAKFPTSKVLCFTRSSPLIHQLPAQYPSHALERQSKDDIKQTLKKLVHKDVDKLMVCKLSNIPSQSHVLELLRSFVHSETAEVLLLVVNMQEIRQQVMNHIRIMIEEEEALLLKENKKQKLFLLLLHFPPSKFANACYPTLFLRGWDHCYLDTVAHSTATGVIDIRGWFWDCCFPPDDLPPPEVDPLVLTLKEILNEAIPILASRVFFGLVRNGHFNTNMSGSKRTKILKTLLFEKGVGNVLCERFRSYWKPGVMSEYLEKAVAFTRSQDSTLNITDSVHTTFKSLFFDFLVYMISRINEDCNIDVLFLPSCTEGTQSLFLDIVRVFKIPKLSELKMRSAHPQLGKEASYLPQFPFFKTVSGEMERLVEDSREEANNKINIVGDLEPDGPEQSLTFRGLNDQQSLIHHLKEIVVRKLKVIVESDEKSFLAHSLKAQEDNPVIWDYYFSDFIARTLHLESSEGISQRILRAFFIQLYEEKTTLERIAQLHVYMNVYHLELAKMATVLRPLDQIQHVSREAPNTLSPLVTSPTKQLVDAVHATRHPLGTPDHLSAFVVGHLFNGLVGAAFRHKSPTSPNLVNNPDKMLMWYKAYRDVMCLPSLKQHVYSALRPGATPAMVVVEARLNVMQTVFLALRSFSDPAQAEPSDTLLADSQKIFHTLFNRYFDVDMELKNGCPRLGDVSEVAVEVITQTGPSPKPLEERDNNQIRLLMEGLFSHFFSADRQGYHEEDRRWFLELANQQDDWCVPHVSDVVIGGTTEQDLLDMLHSSIAEKEKVRTATLAIEIPKGAISMCTFKMYLSRLLGECDRQHEDPSRCGPLLLHQYHPRLQVGEVLLKKALLGNTGPYIPTFYQECPSICPEQASLGRRMQQPLAHLYFLSVLEHVLAEGKSLANMAKAARQFCDLANSGASDPMQAAQQAVLQIELQAVLQVVAKLLAKLLGAESDERALFGELKDSIEDINRLFGDVSTGGEKVGGHGMVVALHLLKVLKSSRKFIELMTTKFEVRCKEIDCLWPIHERLQQDPGESTIHLLPFMLPVGRGEDDLRGLYKRVKKAMEGIHKLNHANNIKELERIATECNSPRRMSGGADRLSAAKQVYSHSNFKMMVWLVIFYDFFDKGQQSPTLCHVIGTEDFSQVAKLKDSEIRLLQCFLDTRLMLCRPEDPNSLRTDEEVLEEGPGGRLRRKRPRVKPKKVDPLHELFQPTDPKKIDQSDRDLRYALANMVAVVLGCEPESNHLWYHLFDQEPLWNTYLTGFMYSSKIKKEGLLYDCGVELTPDGQFGRQDYLKHASRGTYTLHSLYLLLWANFGAFCMALLVLPDAERTIHGPLISEWLSVRHYCISQLRTVWMHIRNNLGISDEERSFLIMRCMKTLYEVLNSDTSTPETRRGVFTSIEELDSYEKLWHTRVYKPSRDEMKEKFIQYSNLMQHVVFVEMRNLELRYPYYPTEQDFTHSVLSSGDVVREDIALLSRFSLQWRRLQAGGELLPDLVEFYQWLHMDLAHLVTYDTTCKVSIKKILNRAVKKYSPDRAQHLEQLFARVKDGYNKYVELIGGAIGVGACAAVRQGNKIYTIDEDIPLLHFLSDAEEEEERNDWLFTVIADIITAHNDMVELPRQVASQPFLRLLPLLQSTAYPREITTTNCIIPHFRTLHGVNELLQLLRSRHRNVLHTYPSFSPGVAQQQSATMSLTSDHSPSPSSPLFHLQELQEDIVISFLAGKPSILEVSTLRTPFRFKVSVPRALQHKADVISSDELAAIQERLPEELKGDMDQVFRKRLEFEFHPAGYHVMLATTTGLRTAAGHLVKSVMGEREKYLNPRQTLADFLLSLYDVLDSFKDALSEIGIRKLTNNQIVCLSELPLVHLYHCLRVFADWMEQGMYDFSALPYTLKAHLQPDDMSALKAIPAKWEASLSELMNEVESMNSLLSHIEAHITSQDAGQSETPIITYLRNLQLITEDDRLPQHIPDSVLIQHFVEFRIVLRGIMSEVQQRLDQEAREKEAAEREPKRWKETVEEIWQEWLPNFRGEVYTGDGDFLFDAAEGRYLFQDDVASEGEDDLMAGEDEEEEKEREEEREQEGREEDDEFSVIPDEGMSVAQSVAQRAENFTPQQVAEFLEGIGLQQYTQSFLESDVSGVTLMEVRDDDLMEAGVHSRLHQVKIITIFKRLITGVSPTNLKVDDVINFLKEQKLDRFVDAFRANAIDGDIMEAILARESDKVWIQSKGKEMTVTDIILEELGITSGITRANIRGRFKNSLTSIRSSVLTASSRASVRSTARSSSVQKSTSRSGKRTS